MTPSTCNACGGELRARFDRVVDPQSGETFRIDACASCGLGHTVPQPDALGRYYGAEYHGGRHGITAAYCAWRRTRFVRSAAGDPNGRALLDVGCGDGTFLLAAQQRGWRTFGTELNPAIARAAGLTVFDRIEEAAAQAPFACVTLWHSLEHLRDPRGALEQLVSLLTPDGVALIAVPDAGGAQARLFGPRWFHLDVPRHLFHFDDRSLTGLLEQSGFEVTRRWHQELELDLFGWTQSALNSVLPTPNVFFYRLTGRKSRGGAAQVGASYLLGSALTAVAAPVTAASTLARSGGTLVVAARKRAAPASTPTRGEK